MIALPTPMNDVTLKESCLFIEKPKDLIHLSLSDFWLLEDFFNHHISQNLAHSC